MSATAPVTPPTAVAVNPNPTIERTVVVDQLALGEVNRIQESMVAPGGKGATVARALSRLGHPSICVGPLGGEPGRHLARLAEAENLKAEWTWVDGETRTNTTVVSASGAADTLINERGPTLSIADWERFCDSIYARVEAATPVSISGSVPPGVSAAQLRDLAATLRKQGAIVYVDSHGMALTAMIECRPWCVKVNDDEAALLLDRPVDTDDAVLRAAEELSELVDGLAIVTRGAKGATIAGVDGVRAHITPPPIDVVSAVGSGDSFLAGLIAGLQYQHMSTIEAVCFASAAGASNAETMTQGWLDPEAVAAATHDCVVQIIQEPGAGA